MLNIDKSLKIAAKITNDLEHFWLGFIYTQINWLGSHYFYTYVNRK